MDEHVSSVLCVVFVESQALCVNVRTLDLLFASFWQHLLSSGCGYGAEEAGRTANVQRRKECLNWACV